MGRTRIAAVLLAASLVTVACGDDDGASPTTVPADGTRSTPTSERETTTEDPKAAVEQAFYDQWDAFVEITSEPDIDNPLIDEFFTGEAKETLLDTISRDLAAGHATKRPDDPSLFDPQVETIELTGSAEASVTECTVDGLMLIDRGSGEVINDTVATVRIRNDFELVDGRWKVARSVRLERWDGIAGCAS